MAEFEFVGTASSPAAPDRVWALVANPASWPSWWEQWQEAESEGPLQEGSVIRAGRLEADVSGSDRPGEIDGARTQTVEVRVLEVAEPSRLVLRNPSLGDERFVFEIAPSGTGSDITYRRIAKVSRLLSLVGRAMKGPMEAQARSTAAALARAAGS